MDKPHDTKAAKGLQSEPGSRTPFVVACFKCGEPVDTRDLVAICDHIQQHDPLPDE
jgi:hypothetical protein